MRVIKVSRIRDFAKAHPNAAGALEHWLSITRAAAWANLTDVRRVFPRADAVRCGPYTRTVFDIKGNAYRLITAIHYDTGCVYIREFLTHAEYDKGTWKEY